MIKDFFRKLFHGKRYGSLYFGLIKNLVVGILLAIAFYMFISLGSDYVIRRYYLDEEYSKERRDVYAEELQDFITDNSLSSLDTDKIAEWAGSRRYMYLMIYKDDKLFFAPDITDTQPGGSSSSGGSADGSGAAGDGEPGGSGTPSDGTGEGNSPSGGSPSTEGKYPGYTGDGLSREEIIADALANDMYDIVLEDGTLIAAVADYSENFYYAVATAISLAVAAFVLTFALVKYMRDVIRRIKRLENDIKIVSRYDINHRIVAEGADELARLSDNAENMRRSILDTIRKEREAVEANTNLVTAVSHDIRTPLTVLLGYIEMMKGEAEGDEPMQSYLASTEKTAMRLKNLADDMFKYLLAFGDTGEGILKEEYDAGTLIEQMLSEHILLLSESGYDVELDESELKIPEGTVVKTDPENLMRIIDNVFSNLYKYADIGSSVKIKLSGGKELVIFECENKIRTDDFVAESNHIGLKTSERLATFVAEEFSYRREDERFISRLALRVYIPESTEGGRS